MSIKSVSILFKTIWTIIARPKVNIYLTFDDGPLAGTNSCIEVCEKMEVPATFFMVGQHWDNLQSNGGLARLKNISGRFELFSHSYSHTGEKYLDFYKDLDGTLSDFNKGHQIIGAAKKITRLPGFNAWRNEIEYKGPKNVQPVCEVLSKNGFKVCGWDIEWEQDRFRNKFQTTAKQFCKNLQRLLLASREFKEYNVVVLIHDIALKNQSNSLELEKMIIYFKSKKRFTFTKISNHPFFKSLPIYPKQS